MKERRQCIRYIIFGSYIKDNFDLYYVLNISKSGLCLKINKEFAQYVKLYLPAIGHIEIKIEKKWGTKNLSGHKIVEFKNKKEKELYEKYINRVMPALNSIYKENLFLFDPENK